MMGLSSSSLGTLVERTTRCRMLLHLPRMEGHGAGPSIKSGTAVPGRGACAVSDEIKRTINTLSAELRVRSPGIRAPRWRSMRVPRSIPACRSTAATRKALGSETPMKTPTGS
jgi:hypothetical protein